jgi:putative intracellular protease/amidase
MSEDSVKVELVSTKGPTWVSSGLKGPAIEVHSAPNLDKADVILIPGAAGPLGDDPESVRAVLAREADGDIPNIAREAFGRPDVTIATVCGGSLILGMAGLLDGRRAVTHHMGMDMLATVGANPVKARVVDDGNLVTGGGVTSGIDVALYLLEREIGPRIAHAVEALFDYERRGTVWRLQGLVPVPLDPPVPTEGHQPDRNIASAKSSCSVVGKWSVSIATPIGKQSVIYDFSLQDGVITGTATQGSEISLLEELDVTGDRLIWIQRITKPLKLHLRFEVTVNQDTLRGTAKAGLMPASRLEGYRLT